MKTFLDVLNEAKIDDDYNRNWSTIERDVFDKIVLADPKTTKDGDGIKAIGFATKQLILPQYKNGENQFVEDNLDAITKALEKFYSDIPAYPKVTNFETVSDFVNFIENPEASKVEVATQETDPITTIYNEYYSDIPRDDFDKIIALDPKTNATGIGEIAKNILLVNYKKNEDILSTANEVEEACKTYYEDKEKLPLEKQQLSSYKSTKEFVEYIMILQESALVSKLRKDSTVDSVTNKAVKNSFRLVGSTSQYDILEPNSRADAEAIAGYNDNTKMVWCTSTRSYWPDYSGNGGRIISFMHKTRYRGVANKVVNWQVAIRDNHVYAFLNGNNDADFPGSRSDERFGNFLYANLDIYHAIKTKEPFNTLHDIKDMGKKLEYSSKPFILDSMEQYAILDTFDLSFTCKEIIISIPKVPAGVCASFLALKSITFNEGVKEIGGQAFMNCPNLTTLVFPDSLEVIEKEAFLNCLKLRGSIRIPDSVKEVGFKAFGRTKCDLKINKDRKTKIKFHLRDKDWVSAHVKGITIQ